MRQRDFIAARQARWDIYASQLKNLRKGGRKSASNEKHDEVASFPENYRALCNDLALARTRGYSLSLVDRLEHWVMQGHAFLYQPRSSLSRDIGRFFSREFPALVRQEWRLSLLACLLLFGPMVWLFWYIGSTPEFVYRVLSPDMVDTYESMYSGEAKRYRTAEDDLVMFAFYVMNNIGVALRTFAAGLVFGIGAALILLFNGIQIGAVAAHLSFEGYHQNFSSFVIGHGAFELPAIALAGAAGARMGLSLLMPGGLSRLDALRYGARRAVRLLYGVIAMLLLAAGLEGFWSASAVPASTKYIVGTALWLLVILYFLFAGRGRPGDRRAD
jgi:uncharacterized membrane protein SpoIIM required for sporulation